MIKKIFFSIFGVIFNGDNCAYDRQIWLKTYLPPYNLNENKKLLDVGCGNGWALYLADKAGYQVTGISFSDKDLNKIKSRKKYNSFNLINHDVRNLNTLKIEDKFDVIVNFENIEHIIDYKKLIKDMSQLTMNGGLVFLTTPNIFHKIPFIKEVKLSDFEDGGHVIRGFSFEQIIKEAKKHDLVLLKRSYISNKLSLILLGISRKFNSRFFKVLTIPLTVIFNFLDRKFFYDYQNSLSVGMIFQKLEQ